MARVRTVDFLPEIFKTQTNKQFLSATLDQLVQEPKFKKTQGFVGRRVGPGVNPSDQYVTEPTVERSNYQLEPGVVINDPNTTTPNDAITFPGIVDALDISGANVERPDRLFTSDYYAFDPFIDLDKFVNFSQYYWLPLGPDPVDVGNAAIPAKDNFTVIEEPNAYSINGVGENNPTITLLRGGNYTFSVSQSSQFWIQSFPGVDGKVPATPNISSRDVIGVANNGATTGTVTFDVPQKVSQQYFYNLTVLPGVDLISPTLTPSDFSGVLTTDFFNKYPDGVDGITDLDGRTIIFTSDATTGWTTTTLFDPVASGTGNEGQPGSYDTLAFDQDNEITDPNVRYGLWRINYVPTSDGQETIELVSVQTIANDTKFQILYGTEYSNTQWYKKDEKIQSVPPLTAIYDVLYYQDGTDPLKYGTIRLQEPTTVENNTLFVDEDIIGQKTYLSPNGVTLTNGLKIQFRGKTIPAIYEDQTYYVEGVGSSIQLIPTDSLITPETYTTDTGIPFDSTVFDSDNFDSNLNAPTEQDYITINRGSLDKNPWTRSNRWFHIDVLRDTATYNKQTVTIDNTARGKRPIIEFRAGIKLHDFGTYGKTPVNIIDFNQTDALSNVNGLTGYGINGYDLLEGSRVIFAADVDAEVRNKIYEVQFIKPDTVEPIIAQPVINLVETSDATPLLNETVVCLNGLTLQGKCFYYDGTTWAAGQNKVSTNNPPLFDIFDTKGYSLSNKTVYPSSSFIGTKLFSYAVGTGTKDSVLGFPLKYLSLNNVGDIVFDNNLYTDSFIYVNDNVSTQSLVSIGYAREYDSRTTYQSQLGWQTAAAKTQEYQQFQFTYNATVLKLDIQVKSNTEYPNIKIYAESKFIDPFNYSVTVTSEGTEILILDDSDLPVGTLLEVLALSDQKSRVGFYQVPINLECNPLNDNSENFTLGTIRKHYQSIAENLKTITGQINGANNIRDLGNVIPYGLTLLQQSSPLTLSGFFLRKPEFQIFDAIDFNRIEYVKFKSRMLNKVAKSDWGNKTTAQIITDTLTDINTGKTASSPFYWSDMMPGTSVYVENKFTFTDISTNIFDTVYSYNFDESNYKAILVYVNDILLVLNQDYTIENNVPSVTITKTLAIGDVVKIQEFETTTGSFIPNTPSKMGLYPVYKPAKYIDNTYITPQEVIRGHDGSITIAFNDTRDDVLLEFETRIYNNIKIRSEIPLELVDVVPGKFRTTDYTLSEINNILGREFLSWVGWNKLDYRSQQYTQGSEFTYNYSTAGDSIDGEPLLGGWRGIYKNFYDTQYPNTRPWELLGFSEMPSWWETVYGEGPYTGGDLVLWDDLEAGRVADPAGEYFLTPYARPGLTKAIPAGDEGQLLSPFHSVVGDYDSITFKKSWTVGDIGPTEASWYSSSNYPFSAMKLLALTRPAEFFSLFVDRDLYKFNSELNQYLYKDRYRFDPTNFEVYGSGTSKASYVNWIVDFNTQLGKSVADLNQDLAALDVRLCYRMASYTDKQYLKIYSEKSSPNSLNTSLLIPDESYDLLLYKNQPYDNIKYSALIVQKTESGYIVNGYSTTNQYFDILVSIAQGPTRELSAGGVNVRVPTQYTDNVVQIPYNYEFANEAMTCDFILSYGKLLEKQGLSFEETENGHMLNWEQMAFEFLYWTQQGWGIGSTINLNPAASKIVITKPSSVASALVENSPRTIVQDQNRHQLPVRELIIDRSDNTISIISPNENTICYLSIDFTAYEHLLILDNISTFSDLIYQPVTNARQSRLRVAGFTTTEWNGTLDAQGFVLNDNNIKEWKPKQNYTKGQIVLFKGNYWSARKIVQPKTEFVYEDWVKSDYDRIQTGLLPNIPNKANQLQNSYNKSSANLENDNNLLSYGLIGFRPREYMQALDLDDTSQVNLYSQFLGTKGTVRSAELFTFANLGKEAAEYNIYENWAIQNGIYGASSNRSFFEVLLDQAEMTGNPSLLQVVNEFGVESDADQSVTVENIYKSSYKITSPNILPTKYLVANDTTLPTAGYVNDEDVDISIFELTNPTVLNDFIDSIGVGTKIWAAKVNRYNWGVFRTTLVNGNVINLSDNLGTTLVSFDAPHNLAIDDVIIIKFFDPAVDGTYTVLGVPSIDSILIAFELADQPTVDGDGIALKLSTMRVQQASDLLSLPYTQQLTPGAEVWVDNYQDNHWAVLQKQQPFTSVSDVTPATKVSNSKYGQSVAQYLNNIGALVGAPEYTATGNLFIYNRGEQTPYVEVANSLLPADDVLEYGYSVACDDNEWAVVGAPGSLFGVGYAAILNRNTTDGVTSVSQLLIAPDQPGPARFGETVEISRDGRWVYVSAPVANQVYAYGRVDVETQQITYVTTGETNRFATTGIVFDNELQIAVVFNNKAMVQGTDYVFSGTDILLVETPTAGNKVVITRKTSTQLDFGVYYGVEPTSTSGSGVGATFTIERTRGTYVATVDQAGGSYTGGDTITISAETIDGGTSPTNDLTITVLSVDGTGGILTISTSGTGVSNTSIFEPRDFLYTAENIWSFSVYVNGVLQRPKFDYEYTGASPDSSTPYQLEFVNNPAAGAAISLVAKTYFEQVDILTPSDAEPGMRFGDSLASSVDGSRILIGAPYAMVGSETKAGKVYIYDRSVENFIVTDTTDKTYSTEVSLTSPTTVTIDGVYINDAVNYYDGGFTTSGNTVTFTSTTTLNYGDVISVSSNTFRHVQTLTATTPSQDAYFGLSVDLCQYNCSVYTGAPNDNSILPAAGSVQRNLNQSRVFGTISTTLSSSTAFTPGDSIRINNIVVSITGTTIASLVNDINNKSIANVVATAINSADGTQTTLTISVKNIAASTPLARLSLAPGLGTAWTTLNFDSYYFTQTITSPNSVDFAKFGESVSIDTSANTLIVGAPSGDTVIPVTFDTNTTTFDAKSTTYNSTYENSGAVYEFDYIPSSNPSFSNPGKFVFGQQLIDGTKVETGDLFGQSVSYVSGILLVGSPGEDLGDSTDPNYGRVGIFNNPDLKPAWFIKRQQQQVVDVQRMNSVFIYDQAKDTQQQYFDYIDPLQGKILGVAQRNLDFISGTDPAKYNSFVTNPKNTWGPMQVGKIWWNTTNVRFLNPNQDDIVYASKKWGNVFPGSTVEVYEWIESTVVPASYKGDGTVLNDQLYSTNTSLNTQGTLQTRYYFWVKNQPEVNKSAGKTLSTKVIAQYIENPRSSGVSYIAGINASTVGIYNGVDYINAVESILHIEFDKEQNNSNVHFEYELLAQDKDDSFISAGLYRKLLDSFSGADTLGNLVPDPNLSVGDRYGVQVRPRQSMFVDRFAALKNYLQYTNAILKQYPIAETRKFGILNSQEPYPSSSSGAYNAIVENLQELAYQDLAQVPVGYRYLVQVDSAYNGGWTIYEKLADGSLFLYRVQGYNTKNFWTYIDWYAPGYNSSTNVVAEVSNFAGLSTLNVAVGSSVRVAANAQGKFEIYLLSETGWDRVGLEDGTIAFSASLWDYTLGKFGFDVEVFDAQYFDQAPIQETRRVIEAINQELFVDDLLIERNRALVLMFNLILSETQTPEWLTKTSLVDIEHKIRDLVPYQVFRRDNQDFVLDYINEVKPYHTQIKSFNLSYDGLDTFLGSLADFDLPAFYNFDLPVPQFVSPILDEGENFSENSSYAGDAVIWQTWPYNQWFDNYKFTVSSAEIISGGSGYTSPPTVKITGDCIVPAEIVSVIDSAGKVIALNVLNPGEGYIQTPTLTIEGGAGKGARAVARLYNTLTRTISTTLKYDRYEYSSQIDVWQPNTQYDDGVLVRYLDKVWKCVTSDSSIVSAATFDPDNWVEVAANTLSGVDRTMGFYVPTVNTPGLELPLLVNGVEYPGVQVTTPSFDQNTGFDRDNFDTSVFDNLDYGPEGYPTYAQSILDAAYSSSFTDIYLGTRATDINVEGGEFVGTYESHAPEELVPGVNFDTVDIKVNTRPGGNWQGAGHGFPLDVQFYTYTTGNQTISWANADTKFPAEIIVSNVTQKRDLNTVDHYTVDYNAKTVTFTSGVNNNDVIRVAVYGVGGGNQLYRTTKTGVQVGNTFEIPVAFNEIESLVIFKNGFNFTQFTYQSHNSTATKIIFDNPCAENDYLLVIALGVTDDSYQQSWSAPVIQNIVVDNSSTLTYTIQDDLMYSNPDNLVVTNNGKRARPAEGVQYETDGSSLEFLLPTRGGYSQSLIADNDIRVYLNDIELTLGSDYFVSAYVNDTTPRSINFYEMPDSGQTVYIAVSTVADYVIRLDPSSNEITFRPSGSFGLQVGDVITITTWNDTVQQNLATYVWEGPLSRGNIITETYDETPYDEGTDSGEPGSFDYGVGTIVYYNDFQLGRTITNGSRLWVTLNGNRLFVDRDFTIEGEELVLASGAISSSDVVAVTMCTDSVVPDELSFHIFQDMRGVQATYRITETSTTRLASTVHDFDDVIYVEDASKLPIPDLDLNMYGIVMIDAERIAYREIDLVNNTISSLQRGTAGTAISGHSLHTEVIDMTANNLLPSDYQDNYDTWTAQADGQQQTFASDITVTDSNAVRVYLGGTETTDYTLNGIAPVTITFDPAPDAGVDVTVQIKKGKVWYSQGVGTPSNGVPLQETNTRAARFLRGI